MDYVYHSAWSFYNILRITIWTKGNEPGVLWTSVRVDRSITQWFKYLATIGATVIQFILIIYYKNLNYKKNKSNTIGLKSFFYYIYFFFNKIKWCNGTFLWIVSNALEQWFLINVFEILTIFKFSVICTVLTIEQIRFNQIVFQYLKSFSQVNKICNWFYFLSAKNVFC